MQIREYQQWLEAWDRERGWEQVDPAHTLVHALEEMGEVARLVLRYEGYKQNADPAALRAEFAEELSDLLVFIFKLAYQMGVDVEDAIQAGQQKANARYPTLQGAGDELARYQARQAELKQARWSSE